MTELSASAIVAPLLAREHAFGVIAFVGRPPRAAYCADDIVLAELIAARMAPEMAAAPIPRAARPA